MQRLIIITGIIILAIGLLWPWLSQLPLGRLPGDIYIKNQNFSFFFPITTMIIVSIILSLLAKFFFK